MFDIREELKKLPAKPGVYLMHDEKDAVIYVGKAVSLKNRVSQYFQAGRNKGAKIERMVTHISRFEYIVTDSEMEALVLECNLIKEYRPRYNTMLTDDKSYPFIKVTVNEAYPRVRSVRSVKKDGARYFGPYTDSAAVKDIVGLIRRLYKIRGCSRNLPRDTGKERPCLYYHMGQCMAPCREDSNADDYREAVNSALKFLSGHYEGVTDYLKEKMLEAADDLQFEKAGELKGLLESVARIAEKQKITGADGEDRDVIAAAADGGDAVVQIFFIRGGKIIGRDHFYLSNASEQSLSALLESFIQQFYSGTAFIPTELMLQEDIENRDLIERWLSEGKGQKVRIRVPQKGAKEKLVELAEKNAFLTLTTDRERLKKEAISTVGAVNEIREALSLSKLSRMEAYDISNISGFDSVGSMVVYEDGRPRRSDYRKFRIKGVTGADDYASLKEVLLRRFRDGLSERSGGIERGFSKFPDLILMDGGKGQVNAALRVLSSLGISIPVCGMVKDDSHRTRGLYYNNVEISLDVRSEGFKLITRIQDEAHRFAIEYHKNLRLKSQVHSVLDDIPGIGPVRRKALMRHFAGIDKIREANVKELSALPGMNEPAARGVYDFFHGEKSDVNS